MKNQGVGLALRMGVVFTLVVGGSVYAIEEKEVMTTFASYLNAPSGPNGSTNLCNHFSSGSHNFNRFSIDAAGDITGFSSTSRTVNVVQLTRPNPLERKYIFNQNQASDQEYYITVVLIQTGNYVKQVNATTNKGAFEGTVDGPMTIVFCLAEMPGGSPAPSVAPDPVPSVDEAGCIVTRGGTIKFKSGNDQMKSVGQLIPTDYFAPQETGMQIQISGPGGIVLDDSIPPEAFRYKEKDMGLWTKGTYSLKYVNPGTGASIKAKMADRLLSTGIVTVINKMTVKANLDSLQTTDPLMNLEVVIQSGGNQFVLNENWQNKGSFLELDKLEFCPGQ